ncbi:MAG: signal recognition particle-docking protein FtsY, partial [Acidimicrobiales bacterium]
MSSTWFWIVVVAVVVLVAVLVSGLLIARRRRISLDKAREVAAKPKRGSYTASSGITLAPGGEAEADEHPVGDRPEVDGQPAVGDDAAVPRDSDQRTVRDVKLPEPEETDEADTADTVVAPAAEIEEIDPATGRLER